MDMPQNMKREQLLIEDIEIGTMSPYPTVVIVSTTHHKESPRVFIFVSGTFDSIAYMTKVPTNIIATRLLTNKR